jgi:hypothetical protein
VRVPFDGIGGREQLEHGPRGERFADGLHTLGKKTPGLAPRCPSGETARGGEPGVA